MGLVGVGSRKDLFLSKTGKKNFTVDDPKVNTAGRTKAVLDV